MSISSIVTGDRQRETPSLFPPTTKFGGGGGGDDVHASWQKNIPYQHLEWLPCAHNM